MFFSVLLLISLALVFNVNFSSATTVNQMNISNSANSVENVSVNNSASHLTAINSAKTVKSNSTTSNNSSKYMAAGTPTSVNGLTVAQMKELIKAYEGEAAAAKKAAQATSEAARETQDGVIMGAGYANDPRMRAAGGITKDDAKYREQAAKEAQDAVKENERLLQSAQDQAQEARIGSIKDANQREMAEIVSPELQFEPVPGNLPGWRGHHAGVVDQQIDRTILRDQPVAKRGN